MIERNVMRKMCKGAEVTSLNEIQNEEQNSAVISRFAELVEQYIAREYKGPARSRYSIQSDDSKPHASLQTTLDDALREVSKGGDTVRALNSLSEAKGKTFTEILLEYIDGTDTDNARTYKAAGIDRRLFSKIQNDRDYQPSKDTCVAFAYALRLNDMQANDLLARAGYTLSHSNKRDLILEYFFRMGVFDLDVVNGVLERLGEKTLGKIHYDK